MDYLRGTANDTIAWLICLRKNKALSSLKSSKFEIIVGVLNSPYVLVIGAFTFSYMKTLGEEIDAFLFRLVAFKYNHATHCSLT